MVRAGRRVTVLAMVAVLGAAVPAVADTGAVQAASGGGAGPGTVPPIGGQLDGVSADSATDAWAVGRTTSEPTQPVIVHWNGTAWSQVPCPNPGMGSMAALGAALYSVSAVSPTDAWAVGAYSNKANLPQTFIVHWNGTAWSQVPSPNPGALAGLGSVSAVSPTDAWTVGGYTTSSKVGRSLIVHWNGTAWSRVKSPNPGFGEGGGGSAVSAVSRTDAWEVGQYAVKNRGFKPMTLRWDGTAWSNVKNPAAPGTAVQLNGVSAASGTDAWAAGTSSTGDNLVLHWNGTAWSQVSVPSPPARMGRQLTGVSTVSATDAWAVGWVRQGGRFEPFFTVALHWNGTKWSRVPSPTVDGSSEFFAVDAVSPTNAWAVGWDGSILIEHWNGTAWSAN